MTEQITLQQWNRTLLHRQHLLDRADEDAIEVLDRCVGMQSQDPRAPFYGMWSRIVDFDPTEVDEMLTEREIVRISLLRATVFLVDAEDARWIRPLLQPLHDAGVKSNRGSKLVGAELSDVVSSAVEILTGQAISGAQLGSELATRHPGEDPSNLTAVARYALPLVQIPPRGLWQGSAAPTYQLFDDWVGPGEPAVTGDDARRDLIRLYLRGFGPSTVAGVQSWSGLTGLRPHLEAMEADWELQRLTGPDGEELYDLEGLDIIDADTPAPARLLAPYDNVLVAQADRRRIADDDLYRKTTTTNGRSPGFVLLDGRLAGTWRLDAGGQVGVDYLRETTASERDQVDAEVASLQEFCAR